MGLIVSKNQWEGIWSLVDCSDGIREEFRKTATQRGIELTFSKLMNGYKYHIPYSNILESNFYN
jgi:hypothetical protein